MDRYAHTFARLKKTSGNSHTGSIGFCPFAVLGDPNETEFLKRIKIYLDAKPDFLELGIPFSDPVADGPIVQEADVRALNAGISPSIALRLIKKIRAMNHTIPIGILVYANIVFRYGIDKFYRDIKAAGVDSILIADVPLEEIAPYAAAAKKHGVHQIFLVSEYTDPARLKKIEKYASGFLYVVSTLGVTGVRTEIAPSTMTLLKKLTTQTTLPLIVGFGISNSAQIRALKKTPVAGFIVGSALVKTSTAKLKTTFQLLNR